MDCCVSPRPDGPGGVCPACGSPGVRVPRATVRALARADVVLADGPYRLCRTTGCDVAWYAESASHSVPVTSALVRIGHKETTPDRPLCYCFGHAASELADPAAGRRIVAEVTERCRRREQRCVQTNPAGTCCLAELRTAALADAPGPDGEVGRT